MPRSIFRFLFFAAVIAGLARCHTPYQAQSVRYLDYRISQPGKADSGVVLLMKPYTDSVNKSMNDLIAVADMELVKKSPEGTLGNAMADAMLFMAKENYKMPVDAAFINTGGIRLPSIPKGNISRGKLFELAPFDNVLVLLRMSGKVFQDFLDHMASRGGWPCAGVQYKIRAKKATGVLVGGQPLDVNAQYTIAINDYIANGGDECDMLRTIPQINNGYLFRDAIIQDFARQHREGKKISAKIENRISYAE